MGRHRSLRGPRPHEVGPARSGRLNAPEHAGGRDGRHLQDLRPDLDEPGGPERRRHALRRGPGIVRGSTATPRLQRERDDAPRLHDLAKTAEDGDRILPEHVDVHGQHLVKAPLDARQDVCRAEEELDATGAYRLDVPPRRMAQHQLRVVDADHLAGGDELGGTRHGEPRSEAHLQDAILGPDVEKLQCPEVAQAVGGPHEHDDPGQDAEESAGLPELLDEGAGRRAHGLPPRASRTALKVTDARRRSSGLAFSWRPSRNCRSRRFMRSIAFWPSGVSRTSADRRCAGLSSSETSRISSRSLTSAWMCWRVTCRLRAMEGTAVGPSRARNSSTARIPSVTGSSSCSRSVACTVTCHRSLTWSSRSSIGSDMTTILSYRQLICQHESSSPMRVPDLAPYAAPTGTGKTRQPRTRELRLPRMQGSSGCPVLRRRPMAERAGRVEVRPAVDTDAEPVHELAAEP